MAFQHIRNFSTPLPNYSQLETVFNNNAQQNLADMEGVRDDLIVLRGELNDAAVTADEQVVVINDAESAVVAAGKYLGVWDTLSGVALKGSTTKHAGSMWLLTADVALIESVEPGIDIVWINILEAPSPYQPGVLYRLLSGAADVTLAGVTTAQTLVTMGELPALSNGDLLVVDFFVQYNNAAADTSRYIKLLADGVDLGPGTFTGQNTASTVMQYRAEIYISAANLRRVVGVGAIKSPGWGAGTLVTYSPADASDVDFAAGGVELTIQVQSDSSRTFVLKSFNVNYLRAPS
jgi:hypothetical protein